MLFRSFVVTMDDEVIRSEDQYLELWHNYGEDHMIDELNEEGQFMNEKDQPVNLKSLNSRFGASFDNAVSALEKYDPEIKYAVNTNYNAAGLQ